MTLKISSKKSYILLTLFFLLVTVGCGQQTEEVSTPIERVVPVSTAYSERGDLAEYQSFPGQVVASGEVSLTAKMGGIVEQVMVKEGDLVKEGQVIIKLEQDDVLSQINQAQAAVKAAEAQASSLENGQLPQQIAQLESAYNQAEANLKNAEDNYTRMKNLYEQGAISQQQFEATELQYKVAKEQYESAKTQLTLTKEKTAPESLALARAQLEQAKVALSVAQTALDNTLIKAPISGKVGSINAKVGQMISPGVAIATVGESSNMEISINVTEDRINSLKVGQEAEVTVDAASDKSLKGEIVSISPYKNALTQLYPVKVRVSNEDGLLKSGMFARVKLVVSLHTQVVMVPEEAVLSYGTEKIIYTVEDGRAKANYVKVGAVSSGKAVITEGLEPGKEIVVQGQELLEDGIQVSVEGRGDQ